jgi:hypothetical protein
MEKGTIEFEPTEHSAVATTSIDPRPEIMVDHPGLVSLPLAKAGAVPGKNRRRRKRFLNFILLELSALCLLVLLMIFGTSERYSQEQLTRPFLIAILLTATAVAIIPVLFYGIPRQKYGSRSRRAR